MTDNDAFIKIVKLLGRDVMLNVGSYLDGHVKNVRIGMKASDDLPLEEYSFCTADPDHIMRRLFDDKPACTLFKIESAWPSMRGFLYGENGQKSFFEWISGNSRYVADTAVSPAVRQAFIEIAAAKPKTREELEFYLDLYFGEHKEAA